MYRPARRPTWVQADKWRQAHEDAESEFRSVGRTHRDDETAAMTAADRDKPLTAAWLNSVAGFSPVQICALMNNI